MGLDGSIGTLQVDWKGKAPATEGHKVLSASKGVIELESTRYPFCFSGEEKDPEGTVSILPFVPFQQDLNRFVLRVKNLPAKTAVVKWGSGERSFTRKQLSDRINLSAEFLENPFCVPFFEVMDRVLEKQQFEMVMIKNLITNFRRLRNEFPEGHEITKAMDVLQRALMNRQEELIVYVRAAVKPVRHTLAIIPGK
jgi:hypothetical protein